MALRTALAFIAAASISAPVVAAPTITKSKTAPVSTTTAVTTPAARPRANAVSKRRKGRGVTAKHRFEIAVQFVRTANDDGSYPSPLTRSQAQAALNYANTVWARKGGDIRFYMHPASNFDSLIKMDELNRDCIYAPGWSPAKVGRTTTGDLDGDGVKGHAGDADVICGGITRLTRAAYGLARANRIVVLSRGDYRHVRWNRSAGRWETYNSSGGGANSIRPYIRVSTLGGTLLAHEIGHYLNVGHTFGSQPKSLAEARAIMEVYAAKYPGANPASVFDPDARAVDRPVLDTSPDPSAGFWEHLHADPCDPAATTASVDITVKGKTQSVVLAPDRDLIMSYFKSCDRPHYISPGQYEHVHKALLHGNRRPLIYGKASCYDNGWQPGPAVGNETQFVARMRSIVDCIVLARDPAPWEVDGRDVYVNPADANRIGFRQRGSIAVHGSRERALVHQLLRSPMLE